MNSEQLQDWLTDVSENFRKLDEKYTKENINLNYQKILGDEAEKTQLLIQYLMNNYENVSLVQPLVAQLLSVYYKVGKLF